MIPQVEGAVGIEHGIFGTAQGDAQAAGIPVPGVGEGFRPVPGAGDQAPVPPDQQVIVREELIVPSRRPVEIDLPDVPPGPGGQVQKILPSDFFHIVASLHWIRDGREDFFERKSFFLEKKKGRGDPLSWRTIKKKFETESY